jgi:hypothetical protein
LRIGKTERYPTGMPTYSFVDTETGEEFDLIMKYSEREEFLQENPNIKLLLSAPMIVTGVSIGSSNNKVPEGFKEVLAKVAEHHPESVVGERYNRKSIKNVRTREIVEKHYKKMKDKNKPATWRMP